MEGSFIAFNHSQTIFIMKKTLFTLILISFLAVNQTFAQKEYTTDTLSMGPGYANDIFYSFENGTVKEIERSNWDIAFYTPKFSAGIIVNGGKGAYLYTYPAGDTSDWAAIDTSGIDETWKPIYNSPTVWEDGAFNVNATGHPDYGWGIYNMATHNLTGDSIYIIKIPFGTTFLYKKLWIIGKQSLANIYDIRYADIDGSNEVTTSIEVAQYENKRFIYYSLLNNEVIDRDPESDQWDILCTKYMDLTQDNEGNWVPYLVTGVTSNVDIGANEFYPIGDDYNNWFELPFDSAKNVIGYDWKYFDMGTFMWTIVDSTAFFAQNYAGDVYKMTFVFWEGASTGKFAFNKMLVSLSSVEEVNNASDITTYPNPASSFVNIKVTGESVYKELIIINQMGQITYQSNVAGMDLENGIKVNLNDFARGMYIIQLIGDNIQTNQKLLVR